MCKTSQSRCQFIFENSIIKLIQLYAKRQNKLTR